MRWTAPLRPLARAGDGILDRVVCVLGAVALCQFPEFVQQYLQRLGGHLDEARRQLAQFEAVATQSQLTLAQFIDRTSTNADTAVAKLAGVMRETVARVEELSVAEAALRNASIWEKPFVFIAHLDRSIAASAWDVYRPAVPTTVEGIVYAVVGVLLALAAYHGLVRYPLARVLRTRTPSQPHAAAV